MPYTNALIFVHKLKLRTIKEWKEYCAGKMPSIQALPEEIPHKPESVYKYHGWSGWKRWLGTEIPSEPNRKFRNFGKARTFARSLRIRSASQWRAYASGKLPNNGVRPLDIPSDPSNSYKNDGWVSWVDWLDNEDLKYQAGERYRNFREARKYVRKLKITSHNEWVKYTKGNLPVKGMKPEDIPSCPWCTYKGKGWTTLGDFLGTGTIATQERKYRPFREARKFARELKIQNRKDWSKYCKGELPQKGKLPDDIPAAPWLTYKSHWISLGDWLGTGRVAARKMTFRPFKDARKFVQDLNLRNVSEWGKYCRKNLKMKGKRPPDIPSRPHETYKKEWISGGDCYFYTQSK